MRNTEARYHCAMETLAAVASCLSDVPQPAHLIAQDCNIGVQHVYRALRELQERFEIPILRTKSGWYIEDKRAREVIARLCDKYWRG